MSSACYYCCWQQVGLVISQTMALIERRSQTVLLLLLCRLWFYQFDCIYSKTGESPRYKARGYTKVFIACNVVETYNYDIFADGLKIKVEKNLLGGGLSCQMRTRKKERWSRLAARLSSFMMIEDSGTSLQAIPVRWPSSWLCLIRALKVRHAILQIIDLNVILLY